MDVWGMHGSFRRLYARSAERREQAGAGTYDFVSSRFVHGFICLYILRMPAARNDVLYFLVTTCNKHRSPQHIRHGAKAGVWSARCSVA